MIYTGCGDEKTPEPILNLMFEIGRYQAKRGDILRSGGTEGAQAFFENGCNSEKGEKEIFLPWKGYNNKHGIICRNVEQVQIAEIVWKDKMMCQSILELVTTGMSFETAASRVGLASKVRQFIRRYGTVSTKDHFQSWFYLSENERAIATRDILQVGGLELTFPSNCVISWTDDGKSSGSAAQSLHYARMRDIPVINLREERTREKLLHNMRKGLPLL